jgi:two-component system, NarL family, sensor histidine kinase UhpB
MPGPLRLLLLEDDKQDETLVIYQLRKGHFQPDWQRVESLSAFRDALHVKPWDLIIADFHLPNCTGREALAVLGTSGVDIPFLLVSGKIGEEAVAEVILAGAAGFFDKANLVHLAPAVERVLRDAGRRRQGRASEERLRLAMDLALLGTFEWDLVKDQIQADEHMLRILGEPAGTPIGSFDEAMQYIYPDDLPKVLEWTRSMQESTRHTRQYRIVRADGTIRWVASRTHIQYDTQGKPTRLLGVLQDINDLKIAEQELRASSERLQHLSRQLLATQEAERRSIARELHDEIGQGLTAAIISLQIALQNPASAVVASDVQDSLKLLETTLRQVRNMSVDLRPAILDDLGLASALKWYIDRVARRSGVKIHLVLDPLPAQLPPELATVCFRVVQEALTNVVRHARASRVDVAVKRVGQMLHLSIRDDGAGFDVAAARQHAQSGGSLGMLSMEERVTLVGGTFTVAAATGRGTRIDAALPLSGEESPT